MANFRAHQDRSTADKISALLENLEVQADGRSEILTQMRELVKANYPTVEETFQYGGLLYKDGSFLFTGLFARRNYITVELGGGAYIDDLYGHLEGKGSKEGRKHIRLFEPSDIREKRVEEYLALASYLLLRG
ncbi:DUF1801 domain-containing protein [Nesterenkonia haasae]|uniref:DUF1801 domain-containing protein n=1 Tax=Nesterenkonia haasae TaxID=2587813 RepID=UPI0013915A65|nr:DUF1801 domain-containing protein [Nesterenkonia haasae]NDK31514.1 DUF1801 domain-containing protein [Nesterenkonia haasae]